MRVINPLGQVLVCLLVLSSIAPPARAERGANTLEEKNWALQFGIKGDLTLGAYESGSVSFKQLLSQRSALRYGVSIHYYYSNSNGEYHDMLSELFVLYQRYLDPDAIVKFYWGMGPYLSFGYNYGIRSFYDSYDESIKKRFGAGWYLLGGVEWFVTDVISIHAEYRGAALYSWYSSRAEKKAPNLDVWVRERDNSSFKFSANEGVLFGLSVYF